MLLLLLSGAALSSHATAAGKKGAAKLRRPAPDHGSISPAAVAPGATTILTFAETNTPAAEPTGVTALWTSFVTAPVPARSNRSFALTLPGSAPTGIGALRLAGPGGVTPWHLVAIDPFPTVEPRGTNEPAAVPLEPPVAVDGRGTALATDRYVIRGRRGQRLVLDVLARRLGSPLDPIVRVLAPDGREIASAEDTPGWQGDVQLDCRLPASGLYRVEIRDSEYRGGPTYRYRLRASHDAIPATPFQATMLATSSNAPDAPTVVREQEPNDVTDRATRVSLRTNDVTRLVGSWQRPGDRDHYLVSGHRGDRVTVRGRSRSLGTGCDVFLRWLKPDGTVMATANLTTGHDCLLTNTLSEDGLALLRVEELNHQGGAEAGRFGYELELESAGPRFRLRLDRESFNVPLGGTVDIPVTIERQGFAGDIELRLAHLPPGFTLEAPPAVTGTNGTNAAATATNTVVLRVSAPTESGRQNPGLWFHTRVSGRGLTDGGKELFATATTLPALRALWPELEHPPRELDGWIAIGTAPPAPAASPSSPAAAPSAGAPKP